MRRPTRLVLGGALAGLAALALWVSWPAASGPARPTSGDRLIAFGDSLVQGVGASPGQDLVSVLSRRLGVDIINAGRSGDTTASALGRLDTAVLRRNPRVVLVLLGGNDLLRRVPPEETIGNLETIATRIRARGAAVVLATVDAGFLGGHGGDAFDALANRTSAALVPDILGGILGRRALMADGIHPNDRGYAVMADRLEPVLRDLMAPAREGRQGRAGASVFVRALHPDERLQVDEVAWTKIPDVPPDGRGKREQARVGGPGGP